MCSAFRGVGSLELWSRYGVDLAVEAVTDFVLDGREHAEAERPALPFRSISRYSKIALANSMQVHGDDLGECGAGVSRGGDLSCA